MKLRTELLRIVAVLAVAGCQDPARPTANNVVVPGQITGVNGEAELRSVASIRQLVEQARVAGEQAAPPLLARVAPRPLPIPMELPVVSGAAVEGARAAAGPSTPGGPPTPGGPNPPPPASPAPSFSFQALTDNNSGIPPDTHGAVGPAHLMTTLNTEVLIQDRSGKQLSRMTLR